MSMVTTHDRKMKDIKQWQNIFKSHPPARAIEKIIKVEMIIS